MLGPLLAYARGSGIDARWAVVEGDGPFFTITKRLHNRLHGIPGDGGPLADAERVAYEAALAPNANDLCALLAPGDIVILHDPQTAGLIPRVRETGVPVIWRCHVGLDMPNNFARDNPTALDAYGAAVLELLDAPERARVMGEAAHERVRERFLGTHSLLDYLALFERLM